MFTLCSMNCVFLKCNVEFYNLVFLHVEGDSTTQTTLIILSSNFIDCVNVKATFGQLNQQKYEGFFLYFALHSYKLYDPPDLKLILNLIKR